MRILKSFGELLIISKQLKHSAKEINHIKFMWKIDTFEEYLQAVTKLRILNTYITIVVTDWYKGNISLS
jgi:hypothetical protein